MDGWSWRQNSLAELKKIPKSLTLHLRHGCLARQYTENAVMLGSDEKASEPYTTHTCLGVSSVCKSSEPSASCWTPFRPNALDDAAMNFAEDITRISGHTKTIQDVRLRCLAMTTNFSVLDNNMEGGGPPLRVPFCCGPRSVRKIRGGGTCRCMARARRKRPWFGSDSTMRLPVGCVEQRSCTSTGYSRTLPSKSC